MRKIVFFDVHGGEGAYFKKALKNVFGLEIIYTDERLDETTARKYHDATIVSVFVTSKVSREVIANLPKLELIACRSTGHDHVDVEAAAKHHILVTNVPVYGENTVAEYTFALLLALSRNLVSGVDTVREGVISHPSLTGFDLAGKTLGIIGVGSIGRQVARLAQSFNMRVLGYDIRPNPEVGINYVGFEELLEIADIITLHLPATKDTHHLLNRKNLAQTKKGVVIINTARGDLIETDALAEAVYSGHVAAAGLDVLEGEDLLRFEEEVSLLHPEAAITDLRYNAEQSILLKMPNVIVTPHNAFNSAEALERIRHATVENIKSFLKHEPQNIVGKK